MLSFELVKKQKILKNIRNEIKKKRLLLDESKEFFGGTSIKQLSKVKNTSDVKGYPFKITHDNKIVEGLQLALKITPIETKFDKENHPSNIEYIILKDFTENIVLENISPHITFFLGVQKISNSGRAIKFLNLKRLEVEEKIKKQSLMLISEYVSGGSIDNWVCDTYENNDTISDLQWKLIVFQLIYTLAVLQHHYKFMHNDFHYGNILIDDKITPGGYHVYTIQGKTYYLSNTGILSKLWDTELSMVYSDKIPDCYHNKYITGLYNYDKKTHKTIIPPKNYEESEESKCSSDESTVPYNYNTVYDLHYFLTNFIDLYISQELFDWIFEIYPIELIPDKSSSYSTSRISSHGSSSSSDNSSIESSGSSSSKSSGGGSSKSSDGGSSKSSDGDSGRSSGGDSGISDGGSSSYYNKYIVRGRMINGIENQFQLPSPIDLLQHKFFENFLIKPKDFDEKTAVYFNARF